MAKIIVLGAAGHAKSVINVIRTEGRHEIVGLIDSHIEAGNEFCGLPVLGSDDALQTIIKTHDIAGGTAAIGDNFVRARVTRRIVQNHPGFEFISAVHPSATVARDAVIGAGTVVMAGVVINPCCSVGVSCILNTGACLDHDSTLDSYVSLGPGVTTGGDVYIGEYTAIGIGATIIHGISIGAHAVVAAGSTVIDAIDDYTVAGGSPATAVRKRGAGDRYL